MILVNGFKQTPSIVATPFIYNDISNPASYPGSGTVLTDLSGNGNTGTLNNGVGYTATDGGALTFDGTNDFVNFANNALNFTGDFSGSVWVKASSVTGSQTLIGNYNAVSGDRGWLFKLNASSVDFNLFGSSVVSLQYAAAGITIGQWVKIGFSRTAGSGTKIFVNGVQGASNSSTVNPLYAATHRPLVGALAYTGPSELQFFAGSLGEVLVYSRALTGADHLQNFNATKTRYGL